MTKLGFVAYALLSSLGAINALEGEKIKEQNTIDNVKKARVKGEKTDTLSGAVRKLQRGGGGYGGGGYGGYGRDDYGARGAPGGYDYGYVNGYANGNGNGNGGSSPSMSKSMKMKMSMKSSSDDSDDGNNRRPINIPGLPLPLDDYYYQPGLGYDDEFYGGPGGDFLDFYGGPCVQVVEQILFEFPPPTDIFAPNGGVFGDIGTTYIWALVTVKGFGTLDGVCTRTWPDFDGVGGDAICNYVLTDPETGDQLLFSGKLDSITPGGALAVTGGSGSVSGVFGDIYIHVEVDDGNDVLDFSQEFHADGLLGIIHCPQKHGSYDPYEYPVYPYW